MPRRHQWFLLFAGLSMAIQAVAYESLIGEYTGYVIAAAGYNAQPSAPCAVSISRSSKYGGSLAFQIRDTETIYMETQNVEKAIGEISESTVKLFTPGDIGRPGELVIFKLGDDNNLKSLKTIRKFGRENRATSMTCGKLSRKH